MEPAIVGFSTCSAAAAFPFTMRAQQHLGVSPRVSGFVLPLALTINMDGTALYQAVSAVFVASAFGLQLTLSQQLTVVFTAVLASIRDGEHSRRRPHHADTRSRVGRAAA